MWILGVNSAYHESAAALLLDGEVIAAAEEERFTGIRHAKKPSPYGSWLLPLQAIDNCLAAANLDLSQIDCFAYSFRPWRRFWAFLPAALGQLVRGRPNKLCQEIGYLLFNSRPGRFLSVPHPSTCATRGRFRRRDQGHWIHVEHHLAHAASAFLPSPFEKAAILSIDGLGENICTLAAVGDENGIRKVREWPYPHSLGFFYEEITRFLGWQRNNDEYKIMALAAYGEPILANELARLVELSDSGDYRVHIDFRRRTGHAAQELIEALGPPPAAKPEPGEREANIAASGQRVLEDTVLHVARWLQRETGMKYLCLAGGVALNCVLNQRLLEESGFDDVWVQPAANDAGTALGAALWVSHYVAGEPRPTSMQHTYLGPCSSDAEIERCLKEWQITYETPDDIALAAARLIASGQIVGWFQGRMEWGPRALGNRSILADARVEGNRDRINHVKGRESFRPVAPAILEEAAGEFLTDARPSPFMLFARTVRKEKIGTIPAVVHVDATARPQTVREDQNPLFYRLIHHFGNLTGVPVVINTSLNYEGRPIARTVGDAIECFYRSGIDCLALGNYLVHKKP